MTSLSQGASRGKPTQQMKRGSREDAHRPFQLWEGDGKHPLDVTLEGHHLMQQALPLARQFLQIGDMRIGNRCGNKAPCAERNRAVTAASFLSVLVLYN
jgi:hypothetical protein